MEGKGFEEAFAKVGELVTTFQANEPQYLSPDYQEAEARKDFIDKFFMALGWDVNHDIQTNPSAQEVKVERARGGMQRKADYAFYFAPNFRDVRFYVEAKKPHGDIATADNYFQTIRYGWGSRTPLAVLTSFGQFHVVDCRFKADIKHALKRCVRNYHYRDYLDREKFAEIYWLLSREAVAGGSLEKLAATLPTRGKDIPPPHLRDIDDVFLDELEKWRSELAHAFKNRNQSMDSESLTEVTQRTLDRLVFMRFLEDKYIETTSLVSRFTNPDTAWQKFCSASRRLDGIYNGIVFKEHAILDSKDFHVDGDVFAEVCRHLSDQYSPYDFDKIPIHILGSIYERFLGKVIVASDKRVRIEEKPAVRKAGGVYYTPQYIVSYIVENTVGKLIEGKTPEQIAEMRFADIACGSGSFLLGIYDLLLSYHDTYYNLNRNKARKGDCLEREGKLYLSLSKKRTILLNNVYAVDVDAQAVEVAQLSLYLRLLKDETTATARQHLMDFEHTAQMKQLLPDLSRNIICGNSLIGRDVLSRELFVSKEERKINPMDFADTFPGIIGKGGFDAIVGNPPYIQLSMEEFRDEITNAYLKDTYGMSGGRLNTFAFFIERARSLIREGGRFSYIVPNTVLSQEYYAELREKLLQNTDIEAITTPEGTVFRGAVVETVILVFRKHTRSSDQKPVNVVDYRKIAKSGLDEGFSRIPQGDLANNYKLSFIAPLEPRIRMIKDKLARIEDTFGTWLNINQAIALKHDRAASLTDRRKTEAYREILDGRHIARYYTGSSPNYFKFDLSKIHSCKREDIFVLPEKILFRRVGEGLIASIDTQKKYALNTLVVVSPKPTCPYDLKYVLALLNSRLLNFYYVAYLKSSKKVFSEIQARQVAQLPFASVDLRTTPGKKCHDELVAKAILMIEAKKQLTDAKTDKGAPAT
jgi:adenine-specific DNA-methyltransferase